MTKKHMVILTSLLLILILLFWGLVRPFYLNTKLCQAILNNDNEKVRVLLKNHSYQLNTKWNYYFTYPMIIAGEFGNMKVIKLLFNAGACIDYKDRTAFSKAVCKGHVEAVEYFIQHGATNAPKEQEAVTPFLAAVRRKRLNIIKLFLKYKEKLQITQYELLNALKMADGFKSKKEKMKIIEIIEQKLDNSTKTRWGRYQKRKKSVRH